MDLEITMLKSMINKMRVEKLVFESLKHEDLTEEFVNKFVATMQSIYDKNIDFLENIVKGMESKGAEKDGKQN